MPPGHHGHGKPAEPVGRFHWFQTARFAQVPHGGRQFTAEKTRHAADHVRGPVVRVECQCALRKHGRFAVPFELHQRQGLKLQAVLVLRRNCEGLVRRTYRQFPFFGFSVNCGFRGKVVGILRDNALGLRDVVECP